MHSIEASILVDAPVAECYRRWCEFERFPEFMRRIVSVRKVAARELTQNPLTQATKDPQKSQTDTVSSELLGQVRAEGGDVWHWEVRGPMNRVYSWNAGIVLNTPNKVISWASAADQDVATAGSVNFLKQPGDQQTLIEVKMSYSAPVPPFGELVADALHYGDNVVYECLKDFKHYMEREYQGKMNPAQRSGEVMTGEPGLREKTGQPEFTR